MRLEKYLQFMEIEHWCLQRKQVEQGCLRGLYYYQLGDDCVLLADAKNTQQEAVLVGQIVNALRMEQCGGYVSVLSLSELDSVKGLIILGAKTATALGLEAQPCHQLIRQHKKTLIVSHSLLELLEDQSLKRQAWIDLKMFLRVKDANYSA